MSAVVFTTLSQNDLGSFVGESLLDFSFLIVLFICNNLSLPTQANN